MEEGECGAEDGGCGDGVREEDIVVESHEAGGVDSDDDDRMIIMRRRSSMSCQYERSGRWNVCLLDVRTMTSHVAVPFS